MTLLRHTGGYWPALGLSLLALVIVTGYTSINACVKAELFPTRVRSLGVALPYALANALFGGTAEYIALWFKKAGSSPDSSGMWRDVRPYRLSCTSPCGRRRTWT